MKPRNLINYTAFSFLTLLIAQPVLAGSVSSCNKRHGDFSDAPASYGTACHDTNRWQQLGDAGAPLKGDSVNINDFNNPEWTSESSPNAVDAGDSGVSWSTSSDGVNWSSFSQSNDLVQGEFVKFQVDVQRSDEGNHKYDEYKIWLDWMGTGTFDDADVVANEKWWKDEDSSGVDFTGTLASNFYNNDLNTYNSPDTFGSFVTNMIQVPLDSILGDLWMRARVTCENSLSAANGFNMLATGYLHQGEVEDYALRVVSKVNAPATAFLFSAVALGLFIRRRKQD